MLPLRPDLNLYADADADADAAEVDMCEPECRPGGEPEGVRSAGEDEVRLAPLALGWGEDAREVWMGCDIVEWR
jgi:hypothetical protein